jgi:hypothetical protein
MSGRFPIFCGCSDWDLPMCSACSCYDMAEWKRPGQQPALAVGHEVVSVDGRPVNGIDGVLHAVAAAGRPVTIEFYLGSLPPSAHTPSAGPAINTAHRDYGGNEALRLDLPARASLDMPTRTQRDEVFRRMDYNGNGALSLAEIDKAVVELWPEFNHKPALMRAYKAADRNGDGFIKRREFRLLLRYVMYFNELWHKFEEIDVDDDRRLSLDEFMVGCEAVGHSGLSREEASREFEEMDSNHGGVVLFDEFCAWCAERCVQRRPLASVCCHGRHGCRPRCCRLHRIHTRACVCTRPDRTALRDVVVGPRCRHVADSDDQ